MKPGWLVLLPLLIFAGMSAVLLWWPWSMIVLLLASPFLVVTWGLFRVWRESVRHRRKVEERGLRIKRLAQSFRIARTQRQIAEEDRRLGLGSAPLSEANAEMLERLAVWRVTG